MPLGGNIRDELSLLEDFRALEERFELATEGANLGVFDRIILDDDAPPPYWTSSMRKLLAYPEGVDPDPDWFFQRVCPEDQERMRLAVEQADRPEGEGRVEVEVRWHHPDGKDRYFLIRSWTLRNSRFQGKPATRSVGVVIDRTSQREAEHRLLQSQKMEAVGQLAGGVAHDFNNLLSVILSCSELGMMELKEEHPAYLEFREIAQAGERAADLTRQLLAFSRRQLLKCEVFELNELLQDSRSMLARLLSESIEVRFVLDKDCSRVYADRMQMLQVVLNLAVNARDAMPEGGTIIVETFSMKIEDDASAESWGLKVGEYVGLAVSDTGVGMDAETKEKIFEPFFTTKAQGRGTGLGLSTVFGVVKQFGGHVMVYSELDMGTTFKVLIPSARGASVTPVEVKKPTSRRLEGTVLLAEDEPALRMAVERSLQRAGFTVLCSDDVDHAVRISAQYPDRIDLLLTDVVMPTMSGRALADRIREQRPDMKVLFMSGYTDSSLFQHGILEKSEHFIMKPITPARLLSALEAVWAAG